MNLPSSSLNRPKSPFFLFSLFVILFLIFPDRGDSAVRITSITPSCAQPNDLVVLSGNGFGSQNVRITINSVPATVVSATGNRATFIVPGGIPPGVATVTATNPGDQSGTIALRIKSATEVCGNQVDDNCDGVVDDPAVCTSVNRRPIANAGPDITAPVGSIVSLDGTASSDPDGNVLTFQWSLIARPTTSTAGLEDATTALPTLRIDQPGAYQIRLIVSDGNLSSTADIVVVSTINSAPVANAGPSQTGTVGTTVTLDGSGSSDIDGDALTYQWSLHSAPADSTATVVDSTAINPRLTIDKAGTYTVQLVVSDGTVTSDPDTTQIDTLNSPPVADAGPGQSARVGETVTLDGGNSHDADANPLIYQWSLVTKPTGSTTALQNPTTLQPTFIIDKAGTYVAQLIVNDGIVNSEPDSVTVSTLNSKPVADAGPDQGTHIGAIITLNGGHSSDVDGDPLTYHWSFTTKPTGSLATLSTPTDITPSFTLDKAGTYVIQLTVNDGTINSDPVTTTVSTLNTKPVAHAGSDQSGRVGATITLDGSRSTDVDGDSLTYVWALTAKPSTSNATLSDPTIALPTFVLDKPGIYTAQLVVKDGQVDSDPVTVTISTLNTKPVANAGPDQDAFVGQLVPLDGSGATDADGDLLSYFWSITSRPQGSNAMVSDEAIATPTFTPDTVGTYVIQLIVHDGTVDSDPDTVTVTVPDTIPPPPANLGQITQSPVTNGQVTLSGSAGSVEGGAQVTVTNSRTNQFVTVTATATGSFTLQISAQNGDSLSILVTDSAGNTSTPGTVTITPPLPPDPATVAPALNRTVVTTVVDSTAFLYTGATPIQTGVAAGTIDAKRAALIRGTVLTSDNTPLSGVTITVLNHPELGQTLSRADGQFDMVVNGGGGLLFTYTKTGYLPAQRQLDVPWQETTTLPEVLLLTRDPQVTRIDLTAAVPMQVARGRVVTDEDGSRQATLFFPQGTQAQMVLADGTLQPLTTFHVRSTEYTVGANGPQAMPAPLPPTSGYTYAVDVSVDEAVAVGGKQVIFSQPVLMYVENFLSFPIGGAVPVGYYHPELGAWIPENNGRVIKILSLTSGLADLDTNGDGASDTAAILSAAGITPAEQQQLATLYAPGQSLWRVATTHFSTFDFNWGIGPDGGGPPDAGDPSGVEGGDGGDESGDDPEPEPGEPGGAPEDGLGDQGADTNPGGDAAPEGDTSVAIGDAATTCGSILECENQVLGENLSVVGTGQHLHYRSDRVPGRKSPYALKIPLTRATLPTGLRRVEVEVWIAGRYYRRSFAPRPSRATYFTWNGRDAYGRVVQGRQAVKVTISFVYGARYMAPAAIAQAFAAFGQTPIATGRSGGLARIEFRFPRTWTGSLGSWQTVDLGLGGWTLTQHHSYDPQSQVLYLGDGSRRVARQLNPEVRTIAGNGESNGAGTNLPATSVSLTEPLRMAFDPAGTLYIVDHSGHKVRKVDANGILSAFAGTGFGFATTGDGGPAVDARLDSPWDIAIDHGGNVFISDWTQHRVRKVDRNGIITTIAGTGVSGFSGDGGPAVSAQLNAPRDLLVDPAGNLYIADTSNFRVRKVSPDGRISTVVGTGVFAGPGELEGQRATSAPVNPNTLAWDPAGNLLVYDGVRKVLWSISADGLISRRAGIPYQFGFAGDGGPAREARLGESAGDVAVDRAGNVYLAEGDGDHRIRRIGTDGIITTVAGTGSPGFSGDGGPAPAARLFSPKGVVVGPEGALYIADSGNRRVRIIRPILPDFTGTSTITIASADGAALYLFDGRGRHLQTVHALTGAVLYTFSYDSAGRLSQIQDRDGDLTQIEHNSNGDPTAIVGPFGQRTTLGVDANGYLATVTNPAGETTALTTTPAGLLTRLTTARGQQYTFTYNTLGRLLRDEDPAGGSQTFARTTIPGGYEVTRTSGLNRVSRYQVTRNSVGARQRRTIYPDGTQVPSAAATNGTRTQTAPTGSVVTRVESGEARFGFQVPFPTSTTVTTPSGLSATTTRTRTATLSTPTNLLSLTNQTDTTTINGRTYTTAYAQASRTFTTTTPAARQQTSTISAQGRLLQTQVPGLSPVTRGYDGHGRLTSLGQGGRSTTLTYDANGYLATITDPLGRTTSFTRDAVGRPVTQTLADGRVITYSYDASGNLMSLTPPSRPAHSFTYSPVELPLNYLTPPVTDGGTNTTSYTYNVDREVTSITRPDGQQIHLSYDGVGRVTSQTLPTGTFGFGYDSAGRLQNRSAPSGVDITYSYDGGLVTTATATGSVPGTVTWTYDNNFRVTAQSVNGGNSIAFTYDTDSLLTGAGALTLGRNTQNGLLTGTTLGSVNDTISYDPFAEPTDYQASISGTPVFHQQYTRDTGGRVTQKSETIQGTTTISSYTYDTAGRLTEVKHNGLTVSSYTYDGNGNRLTHTIPAGTQTGTYDDQDRLLIYNGTTYSYTANGELSSKASPQHPAPSTYQYDVLGNLLDVTLADGTQLSYVIDGAQRRVGKKVNGTLVQGFLYQGQLQPVAELDGSGAVVSRFVYASKANVPDYMVKGGGTYRIISDHLGSPRLVVDITTGAVLQRMDYDEFGTVITDTNPGFQPFGFAGGLYDRDTKLVRFGARDYDAETGRWTTKDPIGFGGGDTNLYGYVLGDPVNLLDPSGTIFDTLLDLASIAYDAYRVAKDNIFGNEDNLGSNLAALGADVAGAALPGVTGLGCGVRAARAAEETLVIGRRAHLAKPGALREGEYILSWPSKHPDSKAEWIENSRRLREAMANGRPIRDVSHGNDEGFFLNAERNLLRNRGWEFNKATGYWMPPL